ncbi:hypothetical protein DFJ73DRAFT_940711 [Zopfochytrium polystomum]|nr:hypothetical protein DFJ73DRAFT_940711 [Zopfochytrium polystomum]
MSTPRHQTLIAAPICSYLPGRDRFLLATLLRLASLQSLALYSIPSATIIAASRRGLPDLIRFRFQHAILSLGAIKPPDTLLWRLGHYDLPTAHTPIFIEWWTQFGQIDYFIIMASERGHVDVLQCWWDLPKQPWIDMKRVAVDCVNGAAAHGHVDVLEWWRTSGAVSDWSATYAPVRASANGHLPVLLWWQAHRLPLLNARAAIRAAAGCGAVHVLDFWRAAAATADFPALCDAELAIKNGQLAALRWFAAAGVPIGRRAPLTALLADQVAVLEWLRESGLPLEWDAALPSSVLEVAAADGHFRAVRWFSDTIGVKPVYRFVHLKAACRTGNIGLLDYLVDAGLERAWNDNLLEFAAAAGHLRVFEWRAERIKLPLSSVPPRVPVSASRSGHVEILQWLKDRGVALAATEDVVHAACLGKSSATLQWWLDNATALCFDSTVVLRRSIADRKTLQWWRQSGLAVDWPPSVNMRELCRRAYGTRLVDALQWWKESGVSFYGVAEATEFLISREEVPALEWMRISGMEVRQPRDVEEGGNFARWWGERANM